MSPFDGIDFNTPVGDKVRQLLEQRLAELRTKLEGITMTEAETQQARGAILELKSLLKPAMRITKLPTYNLSPEGLK